MIISAINIKNIGISICELSIVGSVRIGAIDKVMIVAINYRVFFYLFFKRKNGDIFYQLQVKVC